MADEYAGHSTRIEVDDAFDVMAWGLVLNVSAATIVAAAHEVGADALRVQSYLAGVGKAPPD
ncbi:hypothetical protein ACVWWJ_004029 [Luteibacter sp. HA06]